MPVIIKKKNGNISWARKELSKMNKFKTGAFGKPRARRLRNTTMKVIPRHKRTVEVLCNTSGVAYK